ncbi:hypothetical protein [Streptacidiphilus neutrinimicus]|uniref:hypothetical protein n=1 Tax=Streptacidiphilus neutrinimicus TaxID=105420 RepID=UPI0005A71018|nr:hypothetical protein [Streptacidiphilus neutrinimicus]
MKRSVIRRATALGAAVAALTFGLGAGAAEASTTATANPVVTLQQPYEAALPGKGSVQVNWTWLANAKHVDASDVTLTIDARGLAKVAKVVFSGNCAVHGLVATCSESFQGDSTTVPQSIAGASQFVLSALPGAKPGATGGYKITGHSSAATIVGGGGQVTVGGPDFKLTSVSQDLGKQPLHSVVSEPVGFTNAGNRPANGSRVLFFASSGLTFATHYANCRYGHPGRAGGASVALCSFNGTLRVGEQVATAQPMRLRFTSRALFEQMQGVVGPRGDSATWDWITTPGSGYVWTQGKGAVLGLKVVKPGRATSAPAGTAQLANTYDHSFITGVTARNTADFGTTGFSAKAARGGRVTVKLTLTNHGPADLADYSGGGEATPGLMITPPPGTTVVGTSASCAPYDSAKPQQGYYCGGSAYGQQSGTRLTFTLTLRVDTYVAGATGTVRVRYWPNVPNGQNPYRVWYDPDPRNDTAAIRIN